MKKMVVLLIVTVLAGCSTVSDLRGTTPSIAGVSKKSVSAYSTCVLNEWNKQTYLQPLITQPYNNGYSYQFNDPFRGALIILDVTEDGSGSKFNFYRAREIEIYEKPVSLCK